MTEETNITFGGFTKTAFEWSQLDEVEATSRDIIRRLKYEGWSISEVLFKPIRHRRGSGLKEEDKIKGEYEGKMYNVRDLMALTGYSENAIRGKINAGYAIDAKKKKRKGVKAPDRASRGKWNNVLADVSPDEYALNNMLKTMTRIEVEAHLKRQTRGT